MLYFAYGSNMDPQQMSERCPSAEVVGIGYLPDHCLCFPRLSKNRGCGVSSVEPSPGRATWGVVYRLTKEDLASLDKSEGYKSERHEDQNSYNRVPVTIVIDDTPTKACTYVAVGQANAPLPSLEYLKHLREGARHHHLPADYCRSLDELPYS
ncbi:gamma-glutamylcyclotransferase family protein [Rhizobium sp. A37_96]